MEPAIIVPTATRAYFYARVISCRAGVQDERVTTALAAVPREDFLGPGPWAVWTPSGYVQTPSAEPSLIYADIVVGLSPERTINNGEPSFHARCLNALAIRSGETVVHVGAGTGYYTALMAELVGATGEVVALEIDGELAARATRNLQPWPQVQVQARSGLEPPFPKADVIYVNAGVSQPSNVWLDALPPGGRLLLPLTSGWVGVVLLVTCVTTNLFEVRPISPTAIVPCVGGQDETMAENLAVAFGMIGGDGARKPPQTAARSLRRGSPPAETCWLAGDGWWFSTAPAESA